MFKIKDTLNRIRYVSRSKAKVVDNRDPLKKGRIRILHPILGETSWIDYLRGPSTFTVPSIGDLVYVEADCGFAEYPIAWGNATKGLDENPEIPEVFKRDVPSNRGLYTPGGHLLEMDDGEVELTNEPNDKNFTDKNRGIRLTTKAGNKIHILEDETNGKQYILLEDKSGDFVKLDYKDKKVSIIAKDKIIIDSTGDRTDIVGGAWNVTVTGNVVVNTNGNATVNAKGNVEVAADGNATFKGKSGTEVGNSSSTTQVQGSQVLLAGGGPGVARLGDRAFGIGNLGAPVSSTIIQGSTKVLSG